MNEHPEKTTLMAYQDGELAGQARTDVERHLEACAACRGEAAGMKDVSGLFSDARAMQAPSGLAGRIKLAARERGAAVAEVETIKIARWLTWASAAVLAISCAGVWMNPVTQQTQTIRTSVASGPVRFDPATVLMVADAAAVATPGNEDRQFAQWMVADLSGRLSLAGETGSHD